MPWLFHRWSPDPDETGVADSALHRVTPTQLFLAKQRRKLSPLMIEYLQSCLAHPFSFFEVTHCEPGQGFTLCNLLTGQMHEVLERTASQSVQVHDVIFGQLAVAQGVTLLEATSPVALPPEDKLPIFELTARVRTNADNTGIDHADIDLGMWDIELRELYLDLSDPMLYPEHDDMLNFVDDDIEIHRLIFDIDSEEKALELLRHPDARALGMCPRDELTERDGEGTLQYARFDWQDMDDAIPAELPTPLCTLWIEDGQLIAEVDFPEDADELRQIISDILGASARFVLDEVQTLDQALAIDGQDADGEKIDINDPEILALVSSHLKEHYRTWIDSALPALNGRTPRQAIADPGGRDQVEALVQHIERSSVLGMPEVDASIASMLRQELGL
ncbi:MAG TPA: hypothetical protein VFN25_09115 [Dokdonella sp.]|uniref:hypothetical protein n=1 Tax=Dokdonella sp. TaxID=2291710 RepID=UPI002D80EA14|nr:hypothetical protein [Dokdonella sp.]HET9033053.1 hypothetical protein [Dokdonella sp.]